MEKMSQYIIPNVMLLKPRIFYQTKDQHNWSKSKYNSIYVIPR